MKPHFSPLFPLPSLLQRVVADADVLAAIKAAAATGTSDSSLVSAAEGTAVQPLIAIHDATNCDMGARVGANPLSAAAKGAQADAPPSSFSVASGSLGLTRYPTSMIHRKAAAAMCRLSWGEPPLVSPTTSTAATSSYTISRTTAASLSAAAAAAMGGWERPSEVTLPEEAPLGSPGIERTPTATPAARVRAGGTDALTASMPGYLPGVSSASVRAPDASLPFDACLELDRDRERAKRVAALLTNKLVTTALCRLLFVPDKSTRHVAATALANIMRVPQVRQSEGRLRPPGFMPHPLPPLAPPGLRQVPARGQHLSPGHRCAPRSPRPHARPRPRLARRGRRGRRRGFQLGPRDLETHAGPS